MNRSNQSTKPIERRNQKAQKRDEIHSGKSLVERTEKKDFFQKCLLWKTLSWHQENLVESTFVFG